MVYQRSQVEVMKAKITRINLICEQLLNTATAAFNSNSCKVVLLLVIFVSVTIGMVLGYLAFYKFGSIAKLCKIEYISQDELITLEQKRIGQGVSEVEKELFFGKMASATEIISKLVTAKRVSKEYRDTKLLLSYGPIQGNSVKSISSEVHEFVIDKLRSEINLQIGLKKETGVKETDSKALSKIYKRKNGTIKD